MTCPVMYLNGAGTGTAHIQGHPRITKDPQAAPPACYAEGRLTTWLPICRWVIATVSALRTTQAMLLGSAPRSRTNQMGTMPTAVHGFDLFTRGIPVTVIVLVLLINNKQKESVL